MKKLFTSIFLFCSINLLAQTINVFDDVNAKPRPIPAIFTKISVSSGIVLFLTQGNETALATSVSDEKYETRLKTEVVNGVLKIYYDNKGISWKNAKNAKLKAYLSCNSLEAITGSAGAKLIIADQFSFNNLSISFSSGAVFKGKIQAREMTASVSSGAAMAATGVVSNLTVSASSGAVFNGYELITEFCTASANSGGSVKVGIQKELTASANSGGEVLYKGTGSVKKRVNSGGSVKPGK